MSSRDGSACCERGVVLVWAAILMVVLLGCVALVVDIGYLYLTRAQLQNAADAGALAAMAAIRDGETKTRAQQEAVTVAESNEAAAQNVRLDPDRDVVFGTYNFAAKRFEPGGYFADASAAQVTARRTHGSPAGPVPLFFARVLGRKVADVAATGIAAVGKREVVILQDCTRSFTEEIEDAKAADRALVLAMQEQSLAGDHVGVVSFVDKAKREIDRTLIPDGTPAILDAIDGIRVTTVVGLGTHIAPGFEEARQILRRADENAEKVIVLVSDGMPNPASRRQPAIAAADNCARDGISIFTVTLTQEPGSEDYGMSGADAKFNAGLVRGFGRAYQTPNSEDLVEILTTIAKQMPVRLVE